MNKSLYDSSPRRGPISIIGMHRSGTSLIARLLKLCGLYLGPDDQMFGPNDGNPDGHFEHKDFLRLDEALLRHLGGSWDFPPRRDHDWQNDAALAIFRSEAKELIRSFPIDGPWGWKEPRTTLLLPFWTSIIPNLRFVICVRNPLDVAMSLAKRNGMTIEHGVYLWNRYMSDALLGTQGYPRVFVFYDDLFVNAADEIQRLAMFCIPPNLFDFSIAENVISTNLRHHVSSKEQLLANTAVATKCKLLYLMLNAFVRRASMSEDQQAIIDAELTDLFRVVDELGSQERVVQLQAMLDAKSLMLAETNSRVNETTQQVKQIEGQYFELQQRLEHLQKFANAVQQNFAFRFYRRWLRPIRKLIVES